MTNRFLILPALLLLSLLGGSASPAVEPTEEEQFQAEARKLAPANPQEVRLAALEWLLKRCTSSAAVQTLPAVTRCVKEDPDAAVRTRAVEVLGVTAYQQKEKACPLAVVQALLDRDADVRNIALGCAGMYRSFAPGSVDVLLQAARHQDPGVRGSALWFLVYSAPRQEKARQVIREARKDPDIQVRLDAQAAWFRLTGDLAEFVRYGVRTLTEVRTANEVPAPTAAAQRERERRNLLLLGILTTLHGQVTEKTDEMDRVLATLLKDNDPALRRATAGLVGELWLLPAQAPAKDGPGEALKYLIPYIQQPPDLEKYSTPYQYTPGRLFKAVGDGTKNTVELGSGGNGADFFRGIPGLEKQPPAQVPVQKKARPAPHEVKKKDNPAAPPVKPEHPAAAKKEVQRLRLPRTEAQLRLMKDHDPDAAVRAAAAVALTRLAAGRP